MISESKYKKKKNIIEKIKTVETEKEILMDEESSWLVQGWLVAYLIHQKKKNQKSKIKNQKFQKLKRKKKTKKWN